MNASLNTRANAWRQSRRQGFAIASLALAAALSLPQAAQAQNQVPAQPAQPTQPAPSASRGSDSHWQRLGIAAIAIGAVTAVIVQRRAEAAQTTAQTTSQPPAQPPTQPSTQATTADRTSEITGQAPGLQREEPKQNTVGDCECIQLSIAPVMTGPKDGAKLPAVKLTSSIGGDNDSVLTIKIDARWMSSLSCSAGQGNCAADFSLGASSAAWTLAGKGAALNPVPSKTPHVADAKAGEDPAASVECTGPCGKTTEKEIATHYTIKLAHGRVNGDAGKEFGGSGKINAKDAIAGSITLSITPNSPCNGKASGWTMVLAIGGTAGAPSIDWPKSDRDGDGRVDAKDKAAEPAKPKDSKKAGK